MTSVADPALEQASPVETTPSTEPASSLSSRFVDGDIWAWRRGRAEALRVQVEVLELRVGALGVAEDGFGGADVFYVEVDEGGG